MRTPSVFMPGSAEFSGVLIRKTRPEKVGFPVRLPPILVVHIGRDTVAAPADRYSDAQRDVHHALLDRDELGRMLGRDDVRGKVEIDPAGVQVQRQSHGAAAVVDHRIAARDGKPADRVEIDRPGDVVQGLVFPHDKADTGYNIDGN